MNTLLLTCPQGIIDKTTNCCDVKITETICCALITIAVIVAVTILLWHIINKIAYGCKERREIAKERADREYKIQNDYNEKYLSFLKDLTSTDEKIKLKDSDSPDCKRYIEDLKSFVNK